jgi:hypothetical protein
MASQIAHDPQPPDAMAPPPSAQPQPEKLNCLVCSGTGRNKRGGPCSSCRGTGVLVLSANPMLRGFQLTGRTIGAFFLTLKALAAIAIVLLVVYLIIRLATGA